ncbi:MAG: efflux RND transporter periplasmic adaptor subunit [Spirochaetaceae bacterium]|nr:efflux RND transporter periplasmic adaptor subunit [Spirochaetaceae bacterium]
MTGKTKKILIFSAAFLVLAVVILFFMINRKSQLEVSAGEEGTLVVDVEIYTKRDGIEINGNIEPAAAADLAFPIAGYIDRILVSVGDYVTVGETVAILEDSQQRFNLAEVVVEIDRELVSGTQRNLELLDLKRNMKASELENTRLKSTINGVVTEVNADVGDYVTAQQAGSSADVVVRVINRSSMTAMVEVDELDAPYLSLGQKVEFQFDAYPDLTVGGEVFSIPLEARVTSQGIAVLDTEVVIDSPPVEILPFFTFAGEIFLNADESIILIPSAAVMVRGERSMAFLVVSQEEADAAKAEKSAGGMGGGGILGGISLPEGFGVVPTPVMVAEYSSDKVQVLSGLKAGDQVLVLPVIGESGDSSSEKDSGGTNVLELLGMPSGGPGGGRLPGGGSGGGK